MSLARFAEPLPGDDPCGPDLLEADDDAFLDYYYDAIDRLPARFFTDGKPFEPGSIAIDAERGKVEALLERSRDLRPLAVLAQFAALAHRLPLLAETLSLMAELIERYPDQVHPALANGIEERQTALELLDSQVTMVLPLEHATLVEDKRLQKVTFRAYAVGAGLRGEKPEEGGPDASAIVAALGAEPNAAQVDASYAALTAVRDGLKRIEAACLTADSRPFRPRFERLSPIVAQMVDLIAQARPDLGAAAPDPAAETADADAEADDSATGTAPMVAAPIPTGPVRTHAEAAEALVVIEGYFVRMEPSSPALVLVRQARQLVGQPLIRALELLLGEVAATARIDLAPDTGLVIGAERLRALSELPAPAPEPAPQPAPQPTPSEATPPDGTQPGATPAEATPPKPAFTAESRPEATGLMQAVEGFYRATEPSSPIPMLLFKARASLNRDFTTLLAELFPPKA